MELMLHYLHYIFLLTLWATLTFQLFLDDNADGQQQADEPVLPGVAYTITWQDGDTSSIALGATDAGGYLTASGQGTLTLETTCTVYTAQVGEVSAQAVIALPCASQRLYLPLVSRQDAEIERLQGQMRHLLQLPSSKER